MKTAFERAWERAEKVEVTEEKALELELQPEGAKLAARYLKEEDYDLVKALEGFPQGKRRYIQAGAEATLISNLAFPRNGRLRREANRAMEGLKMLKRNRSQVSHIAARLGSLFAQYQRAVIKSHEDLKKELEVTVRRAQAQQALAQQSLPTHQRLDVERSAEFQQRWHEVQTKLGWEFGGELSRLQEEIARVK
ncbi:MAG TPA: hypothetical protein VJ565_00675 [Dehalococcoidia bacterium]|nr:hypothetical protein [Dehalococcoidia bacterium]